VYSVVMGFKRRKDHGIHRTRRIRKNQKPETRN